MKLSRNIFAVFLFFSLLGCSNLPGTGESTATIGLFPTNADSETQAPSATLEPTSTSSATSTPIPEPGIVKLMAVGDIMMARTVGEHILSEGPEIVFKDVLEILALADILAGNIESAITDTGEPAVKNFTFAAPPTSEKALALAGFDIAILGNNHSLDFGEDGLAQTVGLLQEQGIATLGTGLGRDAAGPLFLEKNGVKIAFLSYVDVPLELSQFDAHSWQATDETMGIAWANPEIISEDVRNAKENADVVIVFMHFGYEGSELPVGYQKNAAIAAIDAGATAVIGSHPHLLQHIEEYHGGLIVYSLGNFVFDGYGMPQNRSAILELVVDKNGMLSRQWYPVTLRDGLPRPADAEQATEILRVLEP